jgi:hypothetical protein
MTSEIWERILCCIIEYYRILSILMLVTLTVYAHMRNVYTGKAEPADYKKDRSLQALLEYSNILMGGDEIAARRAHR